MQQTNKKIEYLEKALLELDDYILTLFLDESEIGIVSKMVKKPFYIKFDGGFDNYERARALISYDDDHNIDMDVIICEIEYDKRYLNINHRNILGTIMSLGIKREMLGDIFVDNNSKRAFFVTTLKMAEYLKQSLCEINHQKVEVSIVDKNDIIDCIFQDGELDKIIVSSRRLDNVIASCLKISRNDACDKIKGQLIMINHVICENVHYQCKDNDLISIRKYGRIKIIECLHETKKERLVLQIKRWH